MGNNIIDFTKQDDGVQGECLPMVSQRELENHLERVMQSIYMITALPDGALVQDAHVTED